MKAVRKYLVVWLPMFLLLVFVLVCAFDFQLVQWAASIYKCPMHAATGVLCPGCGGTRSIMALLHGNIRLALHENPVAPMFVILAVLWYIERVCACFGKAVKLIPRDFRIWVVPFSLVVIWAVARNFVPVLMPLT